MTAEGSKLFGLACGPVLRQTSDGWAPAFATSRNAQDRSCTARARIPGRVAMFIDQCHTLSVSTGQLWQDAGRPLRIGRWRGGARATGPRVPELRSLFALASGRKAG
ncbi:hypothetical protein SL003B_1986 [Polymorphum gilvum SL003B-26A1]|uniref:Uncharacterized protein n=1 Tax=Polymorphum gilvum (strain LMG 25793 / CGMCC 1.9160 / SL003B-26A1) TaxID=991905 RepID=F2IX95_POLGS|nr:hypothetical protein SL003B_1986 [Polymorphum gilvum SL003B-26A1]